MPATTAARRARLQAEANRRRAARNQRRAERRDRHLRLANLKEHEARLIAHVKKLRSLRRPAAQVNAFRMEFVQVRERIRQAGGTPVPHPFRQGKAAPKLTKPAKGPIRPSRGNGRAPVDDDYAPVPIEEGPPPDEDEDEAAGGWDVAGRRGGRRMRRRGGGRRGGGQRSEPEDEEQDAGAGWEEAGYDEAEAMLAGPPEVRARVIARVGRPAPKVGRPAPKAATGKREAPDGKPGFFARIFKPDPEAVRRHVAARDARQADHARQEKANKGGGFLAKIFKKPVVQKVGGNMALTVRPGYRAAIMQVKPGLYVVAEVPAHAVRNGIGDDQEVGILPMLLAPLIATAVQKRMAKRNRDRDNGGEQKLLPGPTDGGSDLRSFMGLEGDDIPAWIDSEVAGEVGCPCEVDTRR